MSQHGLPEANVEAPDAPQRRGRWRRCGCILLVMLLAVVALGIGVVRFGVRKALTDEQWQRMQTMNSQVVDLGPDWRKPAEIPPRAVMEFHDTLTSDVQRILDTYEELLFGEYSSPELMARMRMGLPPPEDQAATYTAFLRDANDVANRTSAAVTLPGYTAHGRWGVAHSTSFLDFQVMAKVVSIVALEHARNGNFEAAFDTASLPILATRRSENAGMISHIVALAVANIAVDTIYAIAEQTTDTAALRRAVDILREYREVAYPGDLMKWRFGDSVGELQRAAAFGFPVDLSPKSEIDYAIEASRLYSGEFDHWLIDNRSADDPVVITARERLANRAKWADYKEQIEREAGGRKQMPNWQRQIARIIMGADPMAWFYAAMSEGHKDTEVRAKVALAVYDLTLLAIERRIAQLEGRDVADEAGTDPFTEESFLFHSDKAAHYSTGPDRADDKMITPYNPSNGTISHGDIWRYRQEDVIPKNPPADAGPLPNEDFLLQLMEGAS